jgi:hypothetical protein
MEEQVRRHDEKLLVQKQEHAQQLKETIDRLNNDKEICEQKYDQKRKALKELEANIGKQTAKTEREKAILAEKYAALETQKAEVDKKYQEETKALQTQVGQLKEALSKDRSAILHENEKLRKQVIELDREMSETQSNYDRDKELWSGKHQFLEQQRDQSRADLLEAQKKFELTLEQLQKRGSIDKDKQETNQMALITSLEQRHRNQIKELNEAHQHLYNEVVQKNKQLEKELKYANDKLHFEQRGKQSEQGTLEKKVTEFQDAHSKISKELDDVKADRDRKILEYQKLFEKERENYKAKLQEVESRFGEADSKRGQQVFEFEKERAKWSYERDQLINQKSEAQEIIARLEKKKDSLLLENEKLKNERVTRKPAYPGVGTSTASIHGGTRYTSMASGKFKENVQTAKPTRDDKTATPSDVTDTDSSHSGKSKQPSKSTRSFAQQPEFDSTK